MMRMFPGSTTGGELDNNLESRNFSLGLDLSMLCIALRHRVYGVLLEVALQLTPSTANTCLPSESHLQPLSEIKCLAEPHECKIEERRDLGFCKERS